MRERLKTKLTEEIILQDYMNVKNEKAVQSIMIWMIVVFSLLILSLLLFAEFLSTVAIGLVTVLLIFLLGVIYREHVKNQSSSHEVEYQIIEDYVIRKEVDSGGENDRYYIILNTYGKAEVADWNAGSRYKPKYNSVQLGQKFYVVKSKMHKSPLLYAKSFWRTEDPTKEQIASEIREEEAVIKRVMACERFPQLTIRQHHYPESEIRNYTSALNKTEENRNLFDRLAANHFDFDKYSAMEYILRYCPGELQKEIYREFSEEQKALRDHLTKLIDKEIREKKRNERKEKLNKRFTGSDQYD